MSARAILFDLDGTLVHTNIDFPEMRRATLAVIADEGIDAAPYADMDSLGAITRALEHAPDAARLRARAEQAIVAIELAACAGAREAEGAIETLAWLRARGTKVGIVTRNSRPAVTRVLASVPLPHDVLLTREDTPRVKPDPVHLALALARLGVPAEHAWMIGDHPMDVAAARAAGTRAIAVVHDEAWLERVRAAAPDAILRSIPELRALD